MREAILAAAITGVALLIGVVGGVTAYIVMIRAVGRDDDFRPIGETAPPPPTVSPFASPRARTETPSLPEGEVKT